MLRIKSRKIFKNNYFKIFYKEKNIMSSKTNVFKFQGQTFIELDSNLKKLFKDFNIEFDVKKIVQLINKKYLNVTYIKQLFQNSKISLLTMSECSKKHKIRVQQLNQYCRKNNGFRYVTLEKRYIFEEDVIEFKKLQVQKLQKRLESLSK